MVAISDFTYNLISGYGYLGLFLVLVIEGMGFPIPVQLLFMAEAYFINTNKMAITLVVAVATFGNLLGNIIAYYLGSLGGKPLVNKLYKFLKISKEDLEQVREWFCKYGSLTNMISRWIGITRTPAIWAAGIFGVNFFSFVLFSMIGNFVWALVSLILYIKLWSKINFLLNLPLGYKISIVVILILLVLVIWWVFLRYVRRHS